MRAALSLLLVACAGEPAAQPGPELPFAGRYDVYLEDADEPTGPVAWFEGPLTVSGPPHAIALHFGEEQLSGAVDGDGGYTFSGPDVVGRFDVLVDDAGPYDDPDYTLRGSVDFVLDDPAAPLEFSFVGARIE